MVQDKKFRVGILGASGYTGADLVRILVAHPNVEIVLMTAERKAGQSIETVFPHLTGLGLPDLISVEEVEWPAVELDVVFCALPHATSQQVISGLLHSTGHSLLDELIIETPADLASQVPSEVRVIDLSADFPPARCGDIRGMVWAYSYGCRLTKKGSIRPDRMEQGCGKGSSPDCLPGVLSNGSSSRIASFVKRPVDFGRRYYHRCEIWRIWCRAVAERDESVCRDCGSHAPIRARFTQAHAGNRAGVIYCSR